jgi:hypothetical protein
METKLLSGIVQSGGFGSHNVKPLPGVSVTVYEATATATEPTTIGTTTTDDKGRFDLPMESEQSERIFYAVATVSEDVELVTIIGSALQYDKPAWITASPPRVVSGVAPDSAASSVADAGSNTPSNNAEADEYGSGNTAYITINELTTVAAAFSMAQFIEKGMIGGDAFGLQIASLMNDNLVDKNNGVPSEVLLSPPNADQTNSLRSTRSLANLIAACVHNFPDAATKLFEYTTPPYGGDAPTNTFEAMFNIARYPASNVIDIYNWSKAAETYSPALGAFPDAWTLAVKVNDSGNDDFLFGGPANIAFDKRGYAWITNNVVQGTPNSGHFAIVLKPNGKPADGKATTPWDDVHGAPKSPLFGGGLLGGGFGVAIDHDLRVWLSNFGWGDDVPDRGSVSVVNFEGKIESPPEGYIGHTHKVQGIAVDQDNNIWLASNENSRIVVFPNGAEENATWLSIPDGFGAFGVAMAEDGKSAWVTASKTLYEYTESNVSRFSYDSGTNQLTCVSSDKFGLALKGLSVDSSGYVWIPSGGEDALYLLDPNGNHVGDKYSGGGINGPWGTAIDGNDNVWVANFGKMLPGDVYETAAISHLAGTNGPQGFAIGQPISPPSGYTLPSAGAPVTLHTGDPLYSNRTSGCPSGPGPATTPMMRLTSVVIDQAGNVWAVNNWKPDFDVDTSPKDKQCGNPGGDGIVIFVGLAKPPSR